MPENLLLHIACVSTIALTFVAGLAQVLWPARLNTLSRSVNKFLRIDRIVPDFASSDRWARAVGALVIAIGFLMTWIYFSEVLAGR